jgi:hypothetical protein
LPNGCLYIFQFTIKNHGIKPGLIRFLEKRPGVPTGDCCSSESSSHSDINMCFPSKDVFLRYKHVLFCGSCRILWAKWKGSVRITCRKTSLLNSKSKSMLIADSTLNPDIFYSLATEIGSFRSSENLNSLLSLSLTCRVFRDACLPVVFADVHWPHRGKHDEQSGLHFFPTNLWPYFR